MTMKTTQPPETLEILLYKFLSLHDLLVNQQVLLEKHTENLAKQMVVFSEMLLAQGTLESSFQQQFSDSLQRMTHALGQTLGTEATDAFLKPIVPFVKKLERASEQTQQALESARVFAHHRFWREFWMTVGCSVFSSLFIVWLLMPKPVLPLNEDQMAIYQWGTRFHTLYQNLSKKDQTAVWNRLVKNPPVKSAPKTHGEDVEEGG